MKKAVLLIGLALLAAAGCGPEQTTQDKLRSQYRDNFRDDQILYDSLKGRYVGTLQRSDGYTEEIALFLSPSPVISPTNPEEATLSGSLNGCLKKGCFKDSDDRYINTFATFSAVKYYPDTHALFLTAQGATSSAGAQATTSGSTGSTGPAVGGSLVASIEATVDGARINGIVYTSKKQQLGTFTVTKTK